MYSMFSCCENIDPSRFLHQIQLEVKEDLTFKVKSMKILDWGEKELQNKKTNIIIILWQSSQIEKETWERESEMRNKYPELFEELGMIHKF